MQPVLAEAAEQIEVKLRDGAIQPSQYFQARGCNACRNHPPVLWLSTALDQSATLQSVHQTGDVGIVVDHALADLAAGQPLCSRAAEDTQGVVLRGRKPMLPQHLGPSPRQSVGGAHQRNEYLLFQAAEALALLDVGLNPPGHAAPRYSL